ncbi:BQ5605_C001g00227 [Microbotryum silenes-dioicae]|uniref:BQ5605_C001g00227 protein n=1 Tax=Microbotryum silenes-dioicae TaxID=796604 RepID=A0A2X0M6Y9_9BASI|nr:BQ5605_C001g00227 [Microbotryum silenes-dioicae]
MRVNRSARRTCLAGTPARRSTMSQSSPLLARLRVTAQPWRVPLLAFYTGAVSIYTICVRSRVGTYVFGVVAFGRDYRDYRAAKVRVDAVREAGEIERDLDRWQLAELDEENEQERMRRSA